MANMRPGAVCASNSHPALPFQSTCVWAGHGASSMQSTARYDLTMSLAEHLGRAHKGGLATTIGDERGSTGEHKEVDVHLGERGLGRRVDLSPRVHGHTVRLYEHRYVMLEPKVDGVRVTRLEDCHRPI